MLRTMKTLARLSMAALSASLLATPASAQTFADEVAFLQKHTKVLVLTDGAGDARGRGPDLQGRVADLVRARRRRPRLRLDQPRPPVVGDP